MYRLLKAGVLWGNTKEVQRLLLESGEDIDGCNEDGQTALHLASTVGHLSIVQLLHRAGANLTFHDKKERRPFQLACESGQQDIVKYLMSHLGRNCTDVPDAEGETPLMVTARAGHCKIVKYLLKRHACDVNSVNKNRQTALHVAVERGHVDVIRTLLKHGATVDRRDHYEDMLGETPMMYAAKTDQSEIVHILIQSGADATKLNKIGKSALTLAAEEGHINVVRQLLTASMTIKLVPRMTRNSPLVAAASHGHVGVVDLLLYAGWTYNLKFAVLEATRVGHTEIVQLVLARLPELEFGEVEEAVLLPKLYQDVFFLAAFHDKKDIMELIIKDGKIDINGWTPMGMQAVHVAIKHGHQDIVQVLVDAGAKIHTRDKVHDLTPFLIAAVLGYVPIMRMLLSSVVARDSPRQQILSSRDMHDNTALHLGVCKGHIPVLLFLLEHKCEINLQNSSRQTPLHLAVFTMSLGLVEILVEAGADLTLTDKEGSTPLMVAVWNNALDIVCLLLDHLHDLRQQVNVLQALTPLQVAAKLGKEHLCSLLIENGSPPADLEPWISSLAHCQDKSEASQRAIVDLAREPLTLTTLCVRRIRCSLRPIRQKSKSVTKLPLPQRLQDMLLLSAYM